MRVTTLGTSSPYPRPGDACSSFLVEGGGSRIWLDVGSGSLAALLAHCRLEQLDAVWVSHTHADHFSDLGVLYYALRYADIHRSRLPVFGPAGWAARLRGVLSHGPPSPIEDVFDVQEVTGGQRASVGGVELTAVDMHHDVPCLGVRLAADGRTVAYTGDTGPCRGLAELASEADLLISEAGYGLDGSEPDPVHLTATEAGAAAHHGAVGVLLLTHLAGADRDACVAAAATSAGCPVIGAVPGLVLDA